jgi:hypothetical protein
MKFTQVAVIALIAVAMMFVAGCTSEAPKSDVVVPTVAPTVAPTVVVTPAPTTTQTVNIDKELDTKFITFINDERIIQEMTTMITIPSPTVASRLTGKIVSGPAAGSQKMKDYRSAILNSLATLDGTSASRTRYISSIQSVLDTGAAATGQYQTSAPTQETSSGFTVRGNGDGLEKLTVTNGGGFIIDGTNNGKSNFIVHITDSSGEVVEFVFNKIGAYSGRKIVNLDEGVYYIEVQSSGSWTIKVTPS